MSADWPSITAASAGALAFAGVWYQSKRGAQSSDQDNRFHVLENTVDQLQEEIARKDTQLQAAEDRARRHDAEMERVIDERARLRRRHMEAVEQLGDAQMQIGDRDREIEQLRRDLAAARGGQTNDP